MTNEELEKCLKDFLSFKGVNPKEGTGLRVSLGPPIKLSTGIRQSGVAELFVKWEDGTRKYRVSGVFVVGKAGMSNMKLDDWTA